MLKPKAIDHIALKVTDMDAAVRFYHDIVGLELVRPINKSEHGGRSAVVGAGSQRIDLFERPDFVSSDKDKPIGMDHVCLVVEAGPAEEVIEYLKGHGVEVFWAPVVRHGHTSVYVYDPDGVHVELQLAERS
jgi:catechol 2,3-dioxygenase-like lactoylglutathione lyase family enzyme